MVLDCERDLSASLLASEFSATLSFLSSCSFLYGYEEG